MAGLPEGVARGAGVACGGLSVVAAVLATRSWAASEPHAFAGWVIVGLVAGAVATVILLPGRLVRRILGTALVLLLVTGALGWFAVASPRREVARSYDGTAIRWSRQLPGDEAAGDDAEGVGSLTVLSAERAVHVRGTTVTVLDPRDGSTVESFNWRGGSGSDHSFVARTADGFAVYDGNRYSFRDPDGNPLRETLRTDELVARAPGRTVILDCSTGVCAAVGLDDQGEEVWRSGGYRRTYPALITDQMPAYRTSVTVVPATPVLERAEGRTGGESVGSIHALDPDTGKVRRSFAARQAGSTLDAKGEIRTFAVRPDGDQCTVRVWESSGRQSDTDPEDCANAAGVVGNHLIFSGDTVSSWVVDLTAPQHSSQLSPPARDRTNRPPVLTETGIGGAAVLRMRFDQAGAQWSPNVVTAGTWDETWSTWWTHETPGDVTAVWVGSASVLASSRVAPLNPWDRPHEDERRLTVLRLSDGEPVGRLRIRAAVDDSAGLPDGSSLLTLQDGRVLRIGAS